MADRFSKATLRILPSAMLVSLCALFACSSAPRGLPTPSAIESRGDAFLESGDYTEASAVFSQATQMRPLSFLARIGLARAYTGLRRFEAFDPVMQQALSLNPRTPEADDLLARTFLDASIHAPRNLRMQYAATALQFFSRARAIAPELPHLSYHAAVAQKQLGNPVAALEILSQAEVESPGLIDVQECASACFRMLGAPKNVIELLTPLEAEGRLTPTLKKDLLWARGAIAPESGSEVNAP